MYIYICIYIYTHVCIQTICEKYTYTNLVHGEYAIHDNIKMPIPAESISSGLGLAMGSVLQVPCHVDIFGDRNPLFIGVNNDEYPKRHSEFGA